MSSEEVDDMLVDLERDAVGDRVREGALGSLTFRWLFRLPIGSPVVFVPVEFVWVLLRCCFKQKRARKFLLFRAVRAPRVRSQIDGSGRLFESHGDRDRDGSVNIHMENQI